jgi:integration host factor subunit beta
MIRSDLVRRIRHQNPHLQRQDVETVVRAIFDEITATLARGDRVELRGFGAFSARIHEARTDGSARSRSKKSFPSLQGGKGDERTAHTANRLAVTPGGGCGTWAAGFDSLDHFRAGIMHQK